MYPGKAYTIDSIIYTIHNIDYTCMAILYTSISVRLTSYIRVEMSWKCRYNIASRVSAGRILLVKVYGDTSEGVIAPSCKWLLACL